jgi:hypothetical protein
MSLTGIHIVFGASSVGLYGQETLPYAIALSQTMASAGTSNPVPNNAVTLLSIVRIRRGPPD